MRKEVVFAIIAGISIGLVIAFGAWKLAQSFKRPPVITETNKTPPPAINAAISLNEIENYDIINKLPFTISGLSRPQSEIVLITENDDYYTKSDNQGEFSLEIDLPAGLSEIKINDQKIKLVYSTEFETDETNNLKRTAFAGSVTDISSGTIQIKADAGEIKQMSYDNETVFVNTLKKNVEVKATDLAIGDYIVAMGQVNGNKVLSSKRVLITGPVLENNYQIISGIIESISKSKIVLTRPSAEVFEITMPKSWNGPDLTDLSVGQRIITVGLMKDQTHSLRTIFTTTE